MARSFYVKIVLLISSCVIFGITEEQEVITTVAIETANNADTASIINDVVNKLNMLLKSNNNATLTIKDLVIAKEIEIKGSNMRKDNITGKNSNKSNVRNNKKRGSSTKGNSTVKSKEKRRQFKSIDIKRRQNDLTVEQANVDTNSSTRGNLTAKDDIFLKGNKKGNATEDNKKIVRRSKDENSKSDGPFGSVFNFFKGAYHSVVREGNKVIKKVKDAGNDIKMKFQKDKAFQDFKKVVQKGGNSVKNGLKYIMVDMNPLLTDEQKKNKKELRLDYEFVHYDEIESATDKEKIKTNLFNKSVTADY